MQMCELCRSPIHRCSASVKDAWCAWQVYDRVTPKAEKPLRPTRAVFNDVTVSNDPVIQCVLSDLQLTSPALNLSSFIMCAIALSLAMLWGQLGCSHGETVLQQWMGDRRKLPGKEMIARVYQ